MELFGSYTSPFVRHCRVVLLQLGQPFDFVETDMAASSQKSPTKRVPFLRDGARQLTDSSTILQYVRQKAGQPFLAEIEDAERYHLANTCLASAVNIFQFERDKIAVSQSAYLQREEARVKTILTTLNDDPLPTGDTAADSVLRVACALGWLLFRNRISLEPYPKLTRFLERAQSIRHFQETAPPEHLR
jgi:glutathione S-transferase